jgi:hypothetical protein
VTCLPRWFRFQERLLADEPLKHKELTPLRSDVNSDFGHRENCGLHP